MLKLTPEINLLENIRGRQKGACRISPVEIRHRAKRLQCIQAVWTYGTRESYKPSQRDQTRV
jgi:hypothetical protein